MTGLTLAHSPRPFPPAYSKQIHVKFYKNHRIIRQLTRNGSSKSWSQNGALVVEHAPSPKALRTAPIPIVFVGSTRSTALESDGGTFVRLGDRLSGEAASRGFMSYRYDLPLEKHTNETAKMILDRLSSELRTLIQQQGIPFPPILYAWTLGCLIAQTYVSSYPLFGLILDSPPLSCTGLSSRPGLADRLPLPLPEFTFEPRFPVLVLEDVSAGGVLKNSRLVKEGADYMEVCEEDVENVESRNVPKRSLAILQWIDELGC